MIILPGGRKTRFRPKIEWTFQTGACFRVNLSLQLYIFITSDACLLRTRNSTDNKLYQNIKALCTSDFVFSSYEEDFILLLVYFITLLQVFEHHSKRSLVNYAHCILILNFIWFPFPLLVIHAQTSHESVSAEEEIWFQHLKETQIAPKPLNLSN